MTKLSVITVNYRGWQPLESCLNSLLSLKLENIDLEVIIVDNFSNDGKLDEFTEKFPDFTFIRSEGNYGFAYGNNLGVQHASGDFLLFLNPDTVISEKPLVSMLDLARQESQISIVSSQQVDLNGNNENPFGIFPSAWTINSIIKAVYSLFSNKKLSKSCENSRLVYPDWVSGSLILMGREHFDQIGGWDEDYWLYSEDTDLCKKVKEKGGNVVLQCQPAITHQHGGTTRRTMRLTAFCKAMVIISKHIYFRKHYSGINHFFLQSFLIINTLLFDYLIPALLGFILFPFGSLRKYLLIYLNLLKYYFNSVVRLTWYIDIKKINPPE
jgi:GT2 family glycosyltransferase